MRYAGWLGILLLVAQSAGAEATRQEQFEALKQEGDTTRALAFVEDWLKSSPDDPDVYVTAANYYIDASTRSQMTVNTARRGNFDVSVRREGENPQFQLLDPKTKKVVGSIGSETVVEDPEIADKALEVLLEAHRRFPHRMDISFGICYHYKEAGDFEHFIQMLDDATSYAVAHPEKLKWMKNAPLSDKPEEFIPRTLHEYCKQFMALQQPEEEEHARRVAEVAVRYYPGHPYAYNDIAGYYSFRKEYKKTLEYLMKAHVVAPKDVLVICNIGHIHDVMGDKAAACEWFQKAQPLTTDPDMKENIADAVKELCGKKKAKTGKR
ncbi:MAG: hypothetical protein K1X53_08430 [Candidatus Sumerlaeaceae bacterium]|nr:hypothetical protein [Candidatus Sumerlaeaceae bacterium]